MLVKLFCSDNAVFQANLPDAEVSTLSGIEFRDRKFFFRNIVTHEYGPAYCDFQEGKMITLFDGEVVQCAT